MRGTGAMKILLADDHALVREGLRHVLRRLDDDAVVVEAADCAEALQLAERYGEFDVVLLDVAMPGMDGLNGLARLRERLPSTPIVILSALEENGLVREAFQRGAQGFIPKSSTGDVLRGALRLVLAGGVYLPPSLLGSSLAETRDASPSTDVPRNVEGRSGLTQRQREVLALIVKGQTNKEIARALNMSETTVRTHATAIFRALNVTNRTQAGHVATKCKLCEPVAD